MFRFCREDLCRVPEKTKRDLGLDAFFPHELVVDSLNPLSRWTSALDNAFFVDPDPIHHNDYSGIVHYADHSGENPFKPFAETLQVKRFLETGCLDNRVAVQEYLVNITSVRLCIRETDAKGFSVNAGESADESLSLGRQDTDVFLEEIREFLHEFPAGRRRQFSSTLGACGPGDRYITFGSDAAVLGIFSSATMALASLASLA